MPKKHDLTHEHRSGDSPLSRPAHSLTYEAVIKELSTELDEGLSPDEATRRLEQYGPNKLDEGEGVSVVRSYIELLTR